MKDVWNASHLTPWRMQKLSEKFYCKLYLFAIPEVFCVKNGQDGWFRKYMPMLQGRGIISRQHSQINKLTFHAKFGRKIKWMLIIL